MMKKILSVAAAIIISFAFVITAFAESPISNAVTASVGYYGNNASSSRNALEMLTLAQLYRPAPDNYIYDLKPTVPVTKEYLDSCEFPSYSAALVILYAAATNTRLSDIAPGVDLAGYIIEKQDEDGFYSADLFKSAVCLGALFAVKAEIDDNKSIGAFLNCQREDKVGWSDKDGNPDLELTCIILSVLSVKRARGDVANAYLYARDYFLSLIDDNGDVIIDGISNPKIAALIVACASDYGIDDLSGSYWKGISTRLTEYQNKDGWFSSSIGGEYDAELTPIAFYGVSACYMGISSIGKLVQGRGFLKPDFGNDIVTALVITLIVVLVIFAVIILFSMARKGRKAAEEN